MPPRFRMRCTQPPSLTLVPACEARNSPARCERLAVAKRDEGGVEVSAASCGSRKASTGVKFSSCIDLVEGRMAQTNTRREVEPAKRNLLNMLPSEAEQVLRDFAVEHGEKPFRGSQVHRDLWQNPAPHFEAR